MNDNNGLPTFAKELSGSHYSNIENNLRNNYFDLTTDENYKNQLSFGRIVEFNNKHFEWIHNLFDYPKQMILSQSI